MKLSRRLLALVPALGLPSLLGGCAIATPFSTGPETAQPGTQALVAVTQAELHPDPALRRVFFDQVEKVASMLPSQPGFLGFSRRLQPFGNNAWTMTVWDHPSSLVWFVESPEHREAMRAGGPALKRSRFARFNMPVASLPPRWPQALEALENAPFRT